MMKILNINVSKQNLEVRQGKKLKLVYTFRLQFWDHGSNFTLANAPKR